VSKPFVVVVACQIERDGLYLLTQRRDQAVLGGLWEFPGGKVEPGESDEDALQRELLEKIGANARIGGLSLQVTHEYERYTLDLRVYHAELAGLERRLETRPADAFLLEQQASGRMQRARLTGRYDDYALAEASVEAAFDASPDGAGPFLTRAALNYTLHRLDRVEADLARAESAVLVSDDTQAAITARRAGLLLQRGLAGGAEALYRQALDLHATPAHLSALAIAQSRQGHFEEAEASLDQAVATYHGLSVEPLAWIALHRGIFDLERAQYDQALVHYDEALALMPGWWLAEEHVAEIHVIQGRDDQALALYRDIVDRTGLPEFMDCIAGVLADQGDAEGAAVWRQRARGVYETQLEQFPEAAAGHALQHYLDAGDRPAQTVALAEANASLRPNAEALTLLADAYEAAGKDTAAALARDRASRVN